MAIKSLVHGQHALVFRYGIPLVGVVVISVVSFFIYNSFNFSYEQEASRAFAESHDLYEQALAAQARSGKGTKSLWPEVELAFKSAYQTYAKSSLAPFFLAFQAEALVCQDKKAAAIEVMNTMLDRMDKKSVFYGMYANKRALIKLDLTDDLKTQGLQELTVLAEDQANIHRDSSWYYLGEYYWAINDLEKAKTAWKHLESIDATGKTPTPSPWFDVVKPRLETVSV